MPDRATHKTAFLQHAGWDGAHSVLVAGDASNRKYERLTQAGGTRILMDAPPDNGEDIRPFASVTTYLRDAGLSAPEIYAQDAQNGFLLLEDLGDDLFARVIAHDPSLEAPLYEAAVDVLLDLHQAPQPDVPRFDAEVMADATCLVLDWYRYGPPGSVNTETRSAFKSAMRAALQPLDAVPPVLIQRDYHAENLIWLPERSGTQRVGLLDYQDAVLGHPAYDLVSILQDARRDVSPDVQAAMIDRYIAGSHINEADFRNAYALLGLQRNLRILGVFARLSSAYGKPHYVDFIPRVWDHVQTGIAHPVAATIAPLIRASLPAPTPSFLKSLRDQCTSTPLQ